MKFRIHKGCVFHYSFKHVKNKASQNPHRIFLRLTSHLFPISNTSPSKQLLFRTPLPPPLPHLFHSFLFVYMGPSRNCVSKEKIPILLSPKRGKFSHLDLGQLSTCSRTLAPSLPIVDVGMSIYYFFFFGWNPYTSIHCSIYFWMVVEKKLTTGIGAPWMLPSTHPGAENYKKITLPMEVFDAVAICFQRV